MNTPQQRHRSLHPLSHDHHHGLVAAVRMKRGEAPYRDAIDLAGALLRLWRSELLPHFEEEESILFNRAYSSATSALVARALDEHAAMRAIAGSIGEGMADAELARRFGELLERHIRFEERELFPALERELDAEALERIGEAIRLEHERREP